MTATSSRSQHHHHHHHAVATATTTSNSDGKKKSHFLNHLFDVLNWIAFVGWCWVLMLIITSYYEYYSSYNNNNNNNNISTTLLLGRRLPYQEKEQEENDDSIRLIMSLLDSTRCIIMVLEGICVIEVLRILVGDLPGNLILGIILHTIRITTIVEVLPRAAAAAKGIHGKNMDNDSNSNSTIIMMCTWIVPAVLASWAVTEVARYPMYMFPTNSLVRSIRMVVPLLTFPIGAFSEFFGAYQVFLLARPGEQQQQQQQQQQNNQQYNQHNADATIPVWLQGMLVLIMVVNGVLGPILAYPALVKKGWPIVLECLGQTPPTDKTKKKPKLRTA